MAVDGRPSGRDKYEVSVTFVVDMDGINDRPEGLSQVCADYLNMQTKDLETYVTSKLQDQQDLVSATR